MAQRITGSKQEIKAAHIPYRLPRHAGPARAPDVLALSAYRAWHATRADLLRTMHRSGEERLAYDTAIELAGNEAEQQFLCSRRDRLATEAVSDPEAASNPVRPSRRRCTS